MKNSFVLLPTFAVLLSFNAKAFAQETISISAVGDIMMGTDYPSNALPSDDGRGLFKYSKERLQSADIRFGNFEGTLFDGAKNGGKSGGPNRYIFRTPTRYGKVLADAGFNVVSLANNHAMDFGAEGIRSTKSTLSANGIQFSSKTGGEVAKFNIRGVRVALIAADFYKGPRSITTPEQTYREIGALSREFDIVIVSVHAGREGSGAERVRDATENFLGENRGNSVEFARKSIDAGASLILMHGPHIPRGMEVYRGHLIAYSLGNFLTERGISIDGNAGLAPMIKVELDSKGRFVRGLLTPFRQVRGSGAVYDSGLSALRFVVGLSERDFPESAPVFHEGGYFTPTR